MLPPLPIEFPIPAYAMIEVLQEAVIKYESRFPILENVRIATKRADAQLSGEYKKQVIVTPVSATYEMGGLKKRMTFNVNFFTASDDDAEELSVALEVVFQSIRTKGFHWVMIDRAPVKVPNSQYTNEHHYWMTLDTLISAKSY